MKNIQGRMSGFATSHMPCDVSGLRRITIVSSLFFLICFLFCQEFERTN
jgi:hypothetical protein